MFGYLRRVGSASYLLLLLLRTKRTNNYLIFGIRHSETTPTNGRRTCVWSLLFAAIYHEFSHERKTQSNRLTIGPTIQLEHARKMTRAIVFFLLLFGPPLFHSAIFDIIMVSITFISTQLFWTLIDISIRLFPCAQYFFLPREPEETITRQW